MLKPENRRKPIIRPYKVITVFNRFIQRYIIVATSADHAIQSIELRDDEVIIEAKELVDYKLVIAK